MASANLVRDLVGEEIALVIREAGAHRRIVKAGRLASFFLRIYPNSGMSAEDIVNEIGAVAACAGVPVELGSPDSADSQLSADAARLSPAGQPARSVFLH